MRAVTIDWELPTLAAAIPGTSHLLTPDSLEACTKSISQLVLPMLIIRKGHLLASFKVQNADGSVVHISGRSDSRVHSKQFLVAKWHEFELGVKNTPEWSAEVAEAFRKCGQKFASIVELKPSEALNVVSEIAQEIFQLGLKFPNGENEARRTLQLGRYFAKRYIIWARVAARPGELLKLEYSYITRFDSDHSPRSQSNLWGLGTSIRRFVGQEPSYLYIPVSRHAASDSYHFEVHVAADAFIKRQSLTLERSGSKSFRKQVADMNAFATRHGASVEGSDEAGGSFAHLYAHRLPGEVRNQVFASVHIAERPPGTTAVVFWLSLIATGVAALLFGLWRQVVEADDLRGIDLAALLVAFPGLAAAWFSRAFKVEGRFRVPLLTRLFLGLIGLSAGYMALTVLLRRGLCTPNVDSEVGGCSDIVASISSRQGVLLIGVSLLVMIASLLITRIVMHYQYRQCQRLVSYKTQNLRNISLGVRICIPKCIRLVL